MALLSDADLAGMQALSEDSMPDTVRISTYPAPTLDELRAQVQGTPTVTETKGRIAPLSSLGLEAERAGQLAQDGVEALRIPRNVAVSLTDTVEVVSARHGTTTAYDVVEVVPLSTYGVSRKVLVKRTGA